MVVELSIKKQNEKNTTTYIVLHFTVSLYAQSRDIKNQETVQQMSL
jgi:UTP:GlnB (protein PII) uridylyltransferase